MITCGYDGWYAAQRQIYGSVHLSKTAKGAHYVRCLQNTVHVPRNAKNTYNNQAFTAKPTNITTSRNHLKVRFNLKNERTANNVKLPNPFLSRGWGGTEGEKSSQKCFLCN